MYTGPNTLPGLQDTIPEYYRDMVDACFAEDPIARPSAEDLLSMLPPTSIDTESNTRHDLNPEPMDIDAMRKCRARSHCCDHCGKQISSVFYKCNACFRADFDVCPTCFDKGMHCDDQTHLLMNVTICGDFPVATQYYSSVNSWD